MLLLLYVFFYRYSSGPGQEPSGRLSMVYSNVRLLPERASGITAWQPGVTVWTQLHTLKTIAFTNKTTGGGNLFQIRWELEVGSW
jgi:hypothetical protein